MKSTALGGEDAYLRRSRTHTDILIEGVDVGLLWDEWGVVADAVVSP